VARGRGNGGYRVWITYSLSYSLWSVFIVKKIHMETIKVISDYTPDVEIPRVIQAIVRGYIITDPSIICSHQLIIVSDDYCLVEFLNGGDINVRTVKFINALQEGLKLKIFVLDLKTNELLQYVHSINNSITDWVLTDLFQGNELLLKDEHVREQ
jgi:hypothetical protein